MLPILKKHDKLEYSDADTHGESWWRERVRRYISSSDEDRVQLWERLDALVQRYKQACPDGWTTFTDADGHDKIRIDVVHATVQVLIVEDRLSDPETNDMYFYIGDDKFGVPKFITVRGTTQVRVSDREKRGLYNHIFGNRGAVRCSSPLRVARSFLANPRAHLYLAEYFAKNNPGGYGLWSRRLLLWALLID